MSIMRSWRRWPRSVSCAPRSSSEPRPEPDPDLRPEPEASISKSSDEHGSAATGSRCPALEAAKFDAALASHRDALFAEWKRDHGDDAAQPPISGRRCRQRVRRFCVWSMPGGTLRRRAARTGSTPRWWCIWMSRNASPRCIWVRCCPIPTADTCSVMPRVRCGSNATARSSVGPATRTISRRLRRALEHRHPTCAVPGCGATRGLHAHHIRHWEDGGRPSCGNLVLLCPLSSSVASSRWHHHHRTRRSAHCH